MNFDITRLTKLAGQDFNSPKCRVTNTHITARESIEIGNYIVSQQERIIELEGVLKSFIETKEDLSTWRFEMTTTIEGLLGKVSND